MSCAPSDSGSFFQNETESGMMSFLKKLHELSGLLADTEEELSSLEESSSRHAVNYFRSSVISPYLMKRCSTSSFGQAMGRFRNFNQKAEEMERERIHHETRDRQARSTFRLR